MIYDFSIFEKSSEEIYLAKRCVLRRLFAVNIDVMFMLAVSVLVRMIGFEDGIESNVNGIVLLAIFYLPEVYFRQTIGMWVMGLTVSVPPGAVPYKVLFVRKIINLFESSFFFVHYAVMCFSKNYFSLSEHITSCMVCRKKY